MTFLSILCALIIEQLQPLRADNPIYAGIRLFAARIETWFNAGQTGNGRIGWCCVMTALVLPAALIYWLCLKLHPVAAFLWNVAVVYLTLGFRHYSHYFTSIQLALNAGDDATARALLNEWTKGKSTAIDAHEIARNTVENALLTSHRHVFGVFFWFLMPVGPAFAVMYRVAEYLSRAWNEPEPAKEEPFGAFAKKIFYWIDWVPCRLSAIAFAVVGNFEDAIYAWRNFAKRWPDRAAGIILSAGGGAIGVRLGTPQQAAASILPIDVGIVDTSGLEADALPGEEPSARALQSTVGLVWRALLLWMLLLLLLSVAVWFG